jgi:hypothetical protein
MAKKGTLKKFCALLSLWQNLKNRIYNYLQLKPGIPEQGNSA